MKLSKREQKLIAGNRRARLTDIKSQLLDEKAKTDRLEETLRIVKAELIEHGKNPEIGKCVDYSITRIEMALSQ